MNPKVCIISGSRAEYGLLRNVILPLKISNLLDLQFVVTGSHLSSQHGKTIDEIQNDSLIIDETIEIITNDDSPTGIANSVSKGIIKSAKVLKKLDPDMILILGDRYEIFAVAIAAMFLNIPISHIHGGESTEALIDESIRHSLTKMSYFHFVAAEDYKKRVVQLGENPNRVFFVGGLGIDSIKNTTFLTKKELEERFKLTINKKCLMVTFHPVTLDRKNNQFFLEELLKALEYFTDTTLIFTLPNADSDGHQITKTIKSYINKNPNAYFFKSLGHQGYLSFLQLADGVVGNSSSGILEAPFSGIGTVNIGDRQKGRLKPKSIIDVSDDRESIKNGIIKILSKDFRSSINYQNNPFGIGKAGQSIVKILEQELNIKNRNFLKKEFFNL
jgi:GDP/UDP-N,N'-diacetylbacillosamine 2-epimerase (hydrolysing)